MLSRDVGVRPRHRHVIRAPVDTRDVTRAGARPRRVAPKSEDHRFRLRQWSVTLGISLLLLELFHRTRRRRHQVIVQ